MDRKFEISYSIANQTGSLLRLDRGSSVVCGSEAAPDRRAESLFRSPSDLLDQMERGVDGAGQGVNALENMAEVRFKIVYDVLDDVEESRLQRAFYGWAEYSSNTGAERVRIRWRFGRPFKTIQNNGFARGKAVFLGANPTFVGKDLPPGQVFAVRVGRSGTATAAPLPNPKVAPGQGGNTNTIQQAAPKIEFLGAWTGSDWPVLKAIRPGMYDNAVTDPPPPVPANVRDLTFKLGIDSNDADFINSDSRHFWVRITDPHVAPDANGRISVQWDTFKDGRKTSFGHAGEKGNSTIELWEQPTGSRIFVSPWLMLTTTKWEVDPADKVGGRTWVRTSSGLPASMRGPQQINAGDKGFRMRCCETGGSVRILHRGYAGYASVFPAAEIRRVRVSACVLVLPGSNVDALVGWVANIELPATAERLARVGLQLWTDPVTPPNAATKHRNGFHVHVCPTPLVDGNGAPTLEFDTNVKTQHAPVLHRHFPPRSPPTLRLFYVGSIIYDDKKSPQTANAEGMSFGPPTEILAVVTKSSAYNATPHEIFHQLTNHSLPQGKHLSGHYKGPKAFLHCVADTSEARQYFGTCYTVNAIWDKPDDDGYNWYEEARKSPFVRP